MNKATMMLVAAISIAAATSRYIGHMFDYEGGRSNTPSFPHNRRRRDRSHAPNDGRWHMKFHRSRV